MQSHPLETYSLYIHGRYQQASSEETFTTINPATGEPLARVQQAALADVDAAVASAQAGFRVWSAMTGTERKPYPAPRGGDSA